MAKDDDAKRPPGSPDGFAMGANAKGEVEVLSPEEYARRLAERNAEEAEDGIARDSKLSKESVDYSPGKGGSRCRNCQHYQGDGACEIVAGEIDPDYWCERFEKR